MAKEQKYKTIDIVVTDDFKKSIQDNLSSASTVIDSREGFYDICEKLLNSGVLSRSNTLEVQNMLASAKAGVGDARVLLLMLKSKMSAFLGEDLQVESKESAPNFDEILHADYTDIVNMLKTYMYGSHGKTKKIQKDARELFHIRDIMKRITTDEKLDKLYPDTINYQYVFALNDIFAKVGPYRAMAEGLIKSAKACEKSAPVSSLGDND